MSLLVIRKGEYNVRCKTFLYCTREVTISWNLLSCVLKRNDLIIKLFLALYLVSIYVEYMYICVHMCIMNASTRWRIFIFMFSLLTFSIPRCHISSHSLVCIIIYIYCRNRTKYQQRAQIYLSIWLILLYVHSKLSNITIRVILDTYHLNVISIILFFDIFFFFWDIYHNIIYAIIWIGVHRTAETFMLYFSCHSQ